MMISLLCLFIGILGLLISFKMLRILFLTKHLNLETYFNKVATLTKMEVQIRNKQRIESLFL